MSQRADPRHPRTLRAGRGRLKWAWRQGVANELKQRELLKRQVQAIPQFGTNAWRAGRSLVLGPPPCLPILPQLIGLFAARVVTAPGTAPRLCAGNCNRRPADQQATGN